MTQPIADSLPDWLPAIQQNHFSLAYLRLTLEAKATLFLPPYKGSTLRGDFGASFRKVSCVMNKQGCNAGQLNQQCAYAYIFETPRLNDSALTHQADNFPHPFIIEPLFPFGFGLSYTNFSYRDLKIEPTIIDQDGKITVSVTVENTGSRAGAEVVQLYLQDLEASVPRPMKELKGFKKVFLKPGEKQRIVFELDKMALAFYSITSLILHFFARSTLSKVLNL
jgi:hypothetical protein